MTYQVREILFLDGNKTVIENVPPLPDLDSRIKQISSRLPTSACWRGYVGTWEILEDRLFLINLTGKYTLTNGPIFADWFSGDISLPKTEALDCVLENNIIVYEQQKHIKIKRGAVIGSYMTQDRPEHFDPSEARKFVEDRGIKSLIHFTSLENLPGILSHGLLGRETLADEDVEAVFNDQYRYDKVADSVCASISFPNYKMFYSLKQKNPRTDWAVLRLSPRVLWELPCAYCFTNAASSEIVRIPLQKRMHVNALKSMFGDVPSKERVGLEIPDEYTTDPQAEVLILSKVDPEYIISVNLDNGIKNSETVKSLLAAYSGHIDFLQDSSLFTYRKDYAHWKREDQYRDDEIPF